MKIGTFSVGTWIYEGDIDEEGQACEYGFAREKDKGHVYKGAFLNNKPHGIGYLNTKTLIKGAASSKIYWGEFREGEFGGRHTK